MATKPSCQSWGLTYDFEPIHNRITKKGDAFTIYQSAGRLSPYEPGKPWSTQPPLFEAFDDANMSICIFGVPSPQTSLAALYARFLSALAYPERPVHRVNASSMDVMRTEIAGRPNDDFVFTAATPTEDVIEFALSRKIPIAISAPPIRLALASIMSTQGTSLEQAIKRASYSLATLAPLIQTGRGSILPRIDEFDSVVPLISALTQCLSFNVPAPHIPSLLKRIAGADATKDSLTLLEQIKRHLPTIVPENGGPQAIFRLPDSNIKDAVGIGGLGPIFDTAVSDGFVDTVIEWPLDLTCGPTSAKQDDNGSIDLTGKARTLRELPPLHFPTGRWRALVELSIGGNVSGNFLALHAVRGRKTIAAGGVILPERGRYSAEISFDVTTPRDPIVLRIELKFGAIEGNLRILRMALISENTKPENTPTLREVM